MAVIERKTSVVWPYVTLGSLLGAVGLFGFTLALVKLLLAMPPDSGVPWLLLHQVETERALIGFASLFQIPSGAILGACAGWAFCLRRNLQNSLAQRVSLCGAALVMAPSLYILSFPVRDTARFHNFSQDLPVLLIWLGLPLLWAMVLMRWSFKLKSQREINL